MVLRHRLLVVEEENGLGAAHRDPVEFVIEGHRPEAGRHEVALPRWVAGVALACVAYRCHHFGIDVLQFPAPAPAKSKGGGVVASQGRRGLRVETASRRELDADGIARVGLVEGLGLRPPSNCLRVYRSSPSRR